MSLIVSSILIISTIIINSVFLYLTKNYKNYNNIIKLKNRNYGIKLLNNFWKKQISIISTGIMLMFLVFFIDDNKIILNTFSVIVGLYVIICNFIGAYNYKKLKKNYVLNENS